MGSVFLGLCQNMRMGCVYGVADQPSSFTALVDREDDQLFPGSAVEQSSAPLGICSLGEDATAGMLDRGAAQQQSAGADV